MKRIWVPVAVVAVVLLGGCSGDSGTADDTSQTETGDASGASGSSSVSVTGTNELKFDPASLSATAGEVTIELTAGDAVNHTVAIEGVDGDAPVVEADAGATASGTATLDAGTYTFYCTVPGHRDAGMEGELTVS